MAVKLHCVIQGCILNKNRITKDLPDPKKHLNFNIIPANNPNEVTYRKNTMKSHILFLKLGSTSLERNTKRC